MTATLTCLRPMPNTGTQDRKTLRKNDLVVCRCGQTTCRDSDVYHEQVKP